MKEKEFDVLYLNYHVIYKDLKTVTDEFEKYFFEIDDVDEFLSFVKNPVYSGIEDVHISGMFSYLTYCKLVKGKVVKESYDIYNNVLKVVQKIKEQIALSKAAKEFIKEHNNNKLVIIYNPTYIDVLSKLGEEIEYKDIWLYPSLYDRKGLKDVFEFAKYYKEQKDKDVERIKFLVYESDLDKPRKAGIQIPKE